MNRIDTMFNLAADKREACLMCYLPCIGPDFERSKEIIDAFIEGGVDYIELSVPGGAPWLDGGPMQKHHLQSRQTSVDTVKAIEFGAWVRERYPDLPILPMAYTGAVVRTGVDRFVDLMAASDLDGIELPDYPSYAMGDPLQFHMKLRQCGMYNINFCDGISLADEGTAAFDLMQRIVTDIDGFLFLTATPGVTGAQGGVATEYLTKAVARIREVQDAARRRRPIMVGFGLTTPDDVRTVIQDVKADAIVVGSAVSRLINRDERPEMICDFIHSLKEATLDKPK
jgi:tryptophan synthase alpha chain